MESAKDWRDLYVNHYGLTRKQTDEAHSPWFSTLQQECIRDKVSKKGNKINNIENIDHRLVHSLGNHLMSIRSIFLLYSSLRSSLFSCN